MIKPKWCPASYRLYHEGGCSSAVDIFHAATGHARLGGGGGDAAPYRAEELFSALHHAGESRVASRSVYFTSLTRQRLQVSSSSHQSRFIFPEKCECAEATLGSPKLFCAAEYDYGEGSCISRCMRSEQP